MSSLEVWLIAMAGFALYLVLLVLVGIYCLIAKEPNLSLLYAVLGGLGTMCIYFAFGLLRDIGIPLFYASNQDVAVPALVAISVVVAIVVYIVTLE